MPQLGLEQIVGNIDQYGAKEPRRTSRPAGGTVRGKVHLRLGNVKGLGKISVPVDQKERLTVRLFLIGMNLSLKFLLTAS